MTTVTVSRELLERCEGIFEWLSTRSVYADKEIKGIHDAFRAALEQPRQERTCGTCKHRADGGLTACKECVYGSNWESK